MQLIDWAFVAIPIVIVSVIALYTRRYVKGVADFMAGGRHAGRFLICTARSEMGAGAVVFVSTFEIFGAAGFSVYWWSQIPVMVGLLLAITGFVVYRYRETRAMTLAQFFEMRYSRRFRIFTGMLAFFAGIVNFGIIPCIGARFFVYFLGLPSELHLLGMDVPTYIALMGVFLTVCTIMTTTGGQITVLVADCAEGMFSQVFYVVVAVALLLTFSWPETKEVLLAKPPGQSLVNPFDSFSVKDFNIWYVLMGMVLAVYGTMAWQNSHAFNSSAASPHESRMGNVLGRWRGFAASVMVMLLAVVALTYLGQPEGQASVEKAVGLIPDARTAGQMRIPIALSQVLPIGIKGIVCSIILMGVISGDGMHLHSWSSIFIQDVVLPLRKKPLTTKQHLTLLRFGVVGVAIWAFCFGALFKQTEYVALWFAVTGAIYIGGAGAAIIGGLYWKRGTTAGAWVGLLTGSVLSVGGIIVRQLYPQFPLNGMQISFFSTLLALSSYVAISLLTCRSPHDMDKLLHRGRYSVESEAKGEPATSNRVHWAHRIMGIDAEFTRSDRWITIGIFSWSIFWFLVFAVGSALYLVYPWSAETWAEYWLYSSIYLPLLIGIVTTVWFTIGCWRDMRLFFSRLQSEQTDVNDDGSVSHGQNGSVLPVAGEEVAEVDSLIGKAK